MLLRSWSHSSMDALHFICWGDELWIFHLVNFLSPFVFRSCFFLSYSFLCPSQQTPFPSSFPLILYKCHVWTFFYQQRGDTVLACLRKQCESTYKLHKHRAQKRNMTIFRFLIINHLTNVCITAPLILPSCKLCSFLFSDFQGQTRLIKMVAEIQSIRTWYWILLACS